MTTYEESEDFRRNVALASIFVNLLYINWDAIHKAMNERPISRPDTGWRFGRFHQ